MQLTDRQEQIMGAARNCQAFKCMHCGALVPEISIHICHFARLREKIDKYSEALQKIATLEHAPYKMTATTMREIAQEALAEEI